MNVLSPETKQAIIATIPGFDELENIEQQRQLIKAIAKNFYWYCERNLAIRTKTGQVVPLRLNWAQARLVEAVLADLEAGLPVRYIILKARQMGFSTVIEALCFWWTATHRHTTSIIMAHESGASENLYNMFRRYYEHAHPSFQPDIKYNTRNDLVFDVEDSVKQRLQKKGLPSPGLDSQIQTMVAKEGRGKSFTASFFHGSEVSAWEDAADVISGVMQAIPLEPNTFAFYESTANGVGGFYYSEYQAAKRGDSIFKPMFFAWHEHAGYEIEGSIESYDEEEKELKDIFKEKGYPEASWDRKLIWRRLKMKEYNSDPAKFYQDYPKDDVEAFLASGRPRFDTRILMVMDKKAQTVKPQYAELVEVPGLRADYRLRLLGEGRDLSPLKVWEEPVVGEKYTIAVDTAEGHLVSGGENKAEDYSVVDVMKVSNLKTVARWRGRIDPDLLGQVVFALGSLYNTALVGVEVNNHGLTVVQYLRNHFYRNLYMRETSEEDAFQERTSQMGWKTTRGTKPKIIDQLATAIRNQEIIDLDPVFIAEAMTYVKDDQGRTNAQAGTHDDCFVRGTKILTVHGDVPVEKIKPGDLVITRDGPRPVVATRARFARVIRSSLGLVGTPEHPVITSRGDIPLSEVKHDDIIHIWNAKQLSIEAKPITDIQAPHDQAIATTFGGTINGWQILSHFTDRFLKTILEPFRQDMLSIIGTGTISTTIPTTLNLSPQGGTHLFIHHHLSADNAQRAIFGTSSESRESRSASGVKRYLSSAEKLVRNIARNCVATTIGQRRVYNLQVAGRPEYFANGILVHNCVMAKAINLEMANYQAIDVSYAKERIFKPTIYANTPAGEFKKRPRQTATVQHLRARRAAHQRSAHQNRGASTL